MRAWELPGFPHAKIRRFAWRDIDRHIQFKDGEWSESPFDPMRHANYLQVEFHQTDWELYVEPKKTRKVKMYMPLFHDRNDSRMYTTGAVFEDKSQCSTLLLAGWTEIEVEVSE
jgi:hypothetical protein